MPALTVATQIISDAHSFRALSGEWDRQVSQSAHYSYFVRWHWNWLWWMHLAPATAQLFLVCCRDRSGELVGLAPLYLRARRILSFLKIQELHLLGMGVPLKTSEYVDLLAKPGWEPAVADAIAAALKDQRVWDRLSLAGVPAESPIANRLMEALGLESQSASFDVAPYIDTSCGWDSYKQVLGRSMRRNVEYYRRRLFQQQSCTFERVTNTDRITEAIDDLIRLHQARWQLAGEPGSFAEPKVAAFLHEAVLAAHSACLLRLWVLRING
jgi:CelD/BcsL family acetyltransferase involved in cellulose biosynthesis